jgi:hypothetical protein
MTTDEDLDGGGPSLPLLTEDASPFDVCGS